MDNDKIGYTFVKVWKVNGKLVVADGIHEAINIYTQWSKTDALAFKSEAVEVIPVEDESFAPGALISKNNWNYEDNN